MNKYRKYILIAVLGAMGLFFVGDKLLENALEGPLQRSRDDLAKREKELRKLDSELSQARATGKQLDVFRAQSLPSDAVSARSLYRMWLFELAKFVELANPTIEAGEPANRRGMYQVIAFAVHGRGTLQQLVRLLYEFYNAGHLHQIRSITATPLKGSDQLELSVTIEALILHDATRKDRLSSQRVERLAYDSLRDYDPILQRNLFGTAGVSDATDYTYLSSVIYVDGQPEAWFDVRTEARLLKLRQGAQLQVGPFTATLVEISDSDVLLECDGERWLVGLGENLAQATAIPPER